MNGGGHLYILDRGHSRLHLDNQVWASRCLRLLSLLQRTCFGQMHFVAQPGHLPLFACLGLDIIGRTNDPLLVPGLRTCSPSSLASREVVILLPDLSQHWDTADLLQFARGIRLLQSLQQRAVEPRADAMSLDRRIEIDPCLDRLIESRMRPVSAAGGTADHTSRALRDEDLVRAT